MRLERNKQSKRSKISIYTRSPNLAPSGYYRIIQFMNKIENIKYKIRPLLSDEKFQNYLQKKNNGWLISLYNYLSTYLIILFNTTKNLISDLIWKPDYIILSRVFVPRYMPFFIKWLVLINLNNSKLIWDFDDDILESNQISINTFKFFCKKSDKIIVTHDELKKKINSKYHHKVILLPTTDGDMYNKYDITEVVKQRSKSFNERVDLVWVATAGNLIHLEPIISHLDEAAKELKYKKNKSLYLTVVCNKPLITKANYLKINNIKWSRKEAIDKMYRAHIGIMPLLDTKFAKGKGGFKLVQYLSIGLPVIASNVGFNSKIVDKSCGILINDYDEKSKWKEEVLNLVLDDYDKLEKLGNGAYSRYLDKYSFDDNLNVWERILREKI